MEQSDNIDLKVKATHCALLANGAHQVLLSGVLSQQILDKNHSKCTSENNQKIQIYSIYSLQVQFAKKHFICIVLQSVKITIRGDTHTHTHTWFVILTVLSKIRQKDTYCPRNQVRISPFFSSIHVTYEKISQEDVSAGPAACSFSSQRLTYAPKGLK